MPQNEQATWVNTFKGTGELKNSLNVVQDDSVRDRPANILINALTRENPDKIGQSCDTDKLRKGLGRVSFESPKAIVPNVDHLPSKSVRTSVVIPNAPVNKDHQTLLGKSFILSNTTGKHDDTTSLLIIYNIM